MCLRGQCPTLPGPGGPLTVLRQCLKQPHGLALTAVIAFVLVAATTLMTAGGASALYSYSSLNNPRMAAIKAGLGLAYLYAGRQLVTGNPTLGYDLGSITSLALVRRQEAGVLRLTCCRTRCFAFRKRCSNGHTQPCLLLAVLLLSCCPLAPGTWQHVPDVACSAEACPVTHVCVWSVRRWASQAHGRVPHRRCPVWRWQRWEASPACPTSSSPTR